MRTVSFLLRKIAAPLAALVIVSSIPSVSYGQALNGVSTGAGVASSVQQGTDSVTDIFIGKGSRGPYVLNWKQIDLESDMVVVNGSTLRRGQDYNIDPNTGVVGFTEALTQGTIARVTYRVTAGKAIQNNGGLSIPLNLTLMQRAGRSLGLTGMLKQGNGTAANPGVSVFGLNMSTDIGSVSKLSSQFMMSSLDDGGKSDKGDFWDRVGMNLGDQITYGDVSVKTSFLRAGENFAGAKDYNMAKGQQAMDFLASYNPGSLMTASMSFKRTDDIGGQDKGISNSLMEQRVMLTLPKAPKMTLTHNVSEKQGSDGSVTERKEISKILMEQSIGKTASASAFMETTDVKNGGVEDTIQTTQLNFNATPTAKLNFASQMIMKDSEINGESSALTLNMNANPSKMVKVALGYSQLDQASQGTTSAINLVVDTTAAPGLNVQTVYNVNNVEDKGDVTTTAVKVAAAVNPKLDIKTSVVNTDASNAEGTQNKDIAIVAKPVDNMNLSVGMGRKEVGEKKDDSRNVRVDLKPFKNTTVNAGYNYVENGSLSTTIRDYTASTKPISFLELAGFYKTRDVTGLDDLDTTSVQWKLDPVKWFKLNGTYARNPEDKDSGAVLRYDSHTLGVETTLGIVSLKGIYTAKDEYLAGRASEEKEIGMGLRMFGHGQLTTGYKISELMQGIDTSTITYSLGYSHNIGSDFSLSLTGRLTQYMRDQMVLDDQKNLTTDLKLQAHF